MLNRTTRLLAAATLALGAGTIAAQADSCSRHGHGTGTVLGAVGGGVIGSAVTHGSLGGVVGGAVLGGLAGNAVARDVDCRHRYHQARYYYRHGHRYSRW
ncbi:MAG: glycine zipper 2TM domain-containing protein [Rhizomicrobium sp.]